ncbi:lipopolysaccharide biosynthesis protein [Brevundimonas staleyi]|uniref:Lipopolysaccharide biosynthesis protein n=1 Tax=Brevundimonas staleyi TaxID=74326 RepID=A0ABW0FXN4_9CAUL
MRRLVTAASLTLASSAFAGLVNFGSQVWFARSLGINTISEYAYAFVATQIVTLAFNFGVNQGVIYAGFSKENLRDAWIFQTRLISFLILIAVLIFLAGSFLLPAHAGNLAKLSAVSIGGYALTLFGHIANVKRESELRYGQIAVVRAVSYVGANAVGIGLCFFFTNAFPMVIRDCFFGLAFSLLAIFGADPLTRNIMFSCGPFSTLSINNSRLMSVTKKNWIVSLGSAGILRLDYAIGAALLGKTSFGVYYQMRALVEGAIGLVLSTIQSVLFSHFAGAGRGIDVKTFTRILWVVVLTLSLVGVGVAATFGSAVIRLVLGPDWVAGAPALVGLVAYSIYRTAFEALTVQARATARYWVVLSGQVVWAACLMVSLPFLVATYGVFGAGVGAAVSAFAGLGLSVVLLRRATPVRAS